MSFSNLRRHKYYCIPTESERLKQRRRLQRINTALEIIAIAIVAFVVAFAFWLHLIPAQPVALRDTKPPAAPPTGAAHSQQIYPPDQPPKGSP